MARFRAPIAALSGAALLAATTLGSVGVAKGKRVEAHADNVRMLGVEIACMVTAQHRKQREQERIRERKGRGRER